MIFFTETTPLLIRDEISYTVSIPKIREKSSTCTESLQLFAVWKHGKNSHLTFSGIRVNL